MINFGIYFTFKNVGQSPKKEGHPGSRCQYNYHTMRSVSEAPYLVIVQGG